MGLSNKIIFPAGYNKIKEFEAETNIGNFKCTLLKEKCMNRFRIRARQRSVKHNGKNYFVDGRIEHLHISNLNPTYNEILISETVNETIVRLKEFNYDIRLTPHFTFKRIIEKFKYDLEKKVIV